MSGRKRTRSTPTLGALQLEVRERARELSEALASIPTNGSARLPKQSEEMLASVSAKFLEDSANLEITEKECDYFADIDDIVKRSVAILRMKRFAYFNAAETALDDARRARMYGRIKHALFPVFKDIVDASMALSCGSGLLCAPKWIVETFDRVSPDEHHTLFKARKLLVRMEKELDIHREEKNPEALIHESDSSEDEEESDSTSSEDSGHL